MDDTLPGAAYVEAVRKALDGPDPVVDPVGDGYSVRAASSRPVTDGAWPELEVAWTELPDDPDVAQVPRTGTLRLPFGRTWLDLSFYPDPLDYARLVRFEMEQAARRARRASGRPPAPAQLPANEVAAEWAGFLAQLEELGEAVHEVREVRPGRVEVDVVGWAGRPAVLTFLITPGEWADLRHRGGAEYGLDELLSAYDDDEIFFRYDGTGFSRSVREELPRVRGTAALRRFAASRAKNPGATVGWFAHKPGTERETSRPTQR